MSSQTNSDQTEENFKNYKKFISAIPSLKLQKTTLAEVSKTSTKLQQDQLRNYQWGLLVNGVDEDGYLWITLIQQKHRHFISFGPDWNLGFSEQKNPGASWWISYPNRRFRCDTFTSLMIHLKLRANNYREFEIPRQTDYNNPDSSLSDDSDSEDFGYDRFERDTTIMANLI